MTAKTSSSTPSSSSWLQTTLESDDYYLTFSSKIDQFNSTKNKVIFCFDCLSQVLSGPLHPYNGQAENYLKDRLFVFAMSNPDETKKALAEEHHKYEEKMACTIRKVTFLTKKTFISDKSDWLLFNTKFSYHLNERYGKNNRMSKAVVYLITGFGGFVFALNNLNNDDNSGNRNSTLSSLTLMTGATMIFYPIVESVYHAYKGEF